MFTQFHITFTFFLPFTPLIPSHTKRLKKFTYEKTNLFVKTLNFNSRKLNCILIIFSCKHFLFVKNVSNDYSNWMWNVYRILNVYIFLGTKLKIKYLVFSRYSTLYLQPQYIDSICRPHRSISSLSSLFYETLASSSILVANWKLF